MIYIGLFATDAVISVLNDITSYFIPNLLFSKIRNTIAFATVLMALPYTFSIFYFRLKKWFIYFLPLFFNLVGDVVGSANVVNLVDDSSLFTVFAMELSPHWVYGHFPRYFFVQLLISSSQLVIAAVVLKTSYEQRKDILEKDVRILKALAINFMLGGVFLVSQVVSIILIFQASSKGFLELSGTSINSVEKVYTKDGKTVHLIPMIHVGSESFYKDVSKIDGSRKTLILLEGVRDKKELIKSFSYKNPILPAQEDHFTPKATVEPQQSNIRYLVADLDVSEFDPKTQKYLKKISKKLREESFFHFILESDEINENADAATLSVDIIERRNIKVLTELKKHEKDYERFYIPWGALHMPQIEREILNQGYKLAETKPRAVVSIEEILAGNKKK